MSLRDPYLSRSTAASSTTAANSRAWLLFSGVLVSASWIAMAGAESMQPSLRVPSDRWKAGTETQTG